MNILIVVRLDSDTDGVAADLRASGYQPTVPAFIPRTIFVEGDEALRQKIKSDPRVRSARDGDAPVFGPNAANQIIHKDQIAYDPTAMGNWGLARIIRRDPPWPTPIPLPFSTFFESGRDGTGVDIYILDSGCQSDHPEFEKPGGGSKVTIMNYGPMSKALPDTPGHGTSVTACAVGNTVGVARGAEVFFYSVALNRTGAISPAAVVSRISDIIAHYNSRAALNRPAILNMSFEGTGGSSADVGPAVDAAISAGIICICAAGNGGADIDSIASYPAFLAGVLPVPAMFATDTIVRARSFTSSFGRRACIGAPGYLLQIPTSYEADASGWTVGSGTSFASPYTAGVLACMLQGTDRLTNQKQVRQALSRLWRAATPNRSKKVLAGPIFVPPRLLYLDPLAMTPAPAVPQQVETDDPYYPMVGFLMNMAQPDGSTTVTDLGPVGRSTTVSGAVQFQSGALVFSGAGSVTVANDAEMTIGAGGEQLGFSVELEVSFDDLSSGVNTFVTGQWESVSGARCWLIYMNSGNLYFIASVNGSVTTQAVLIPAGQMELGRRYQIAVSSDGAVSRGYVDGQLVAAIPVPTGSNGSSGWNTSTRPLVIGNAYSSVALNMKLYGYRFTRAICRHHAGFIGDFPAAFATTCTRGYVGKGPFAFSTSTTTANVTLPPRLQVGDKLLVFLQTGATAPTPPSGWALVTSFATQDNSRRTFIYQRTVAATAEGGTAVTFTLGGSVGAGSSLLCVAFREPDLAHSENLLGGLSNCPENTRRIVYPKYANTSSEKKLAFFVFSPTTNAGDTISESAVWLTDAINPLTLTAFSGSTRMRLGFRYIDPGEIVEPLFKLPFSNSTAANSLKPVQLATVVFDT